MGRVTRLRVYRHVLTTVHPAGARILRWALISALGGIASGIASLTCAFTWAFTGADHPVLMVACHWLARVTYACAVSVWVCAGLLWLNRRRRRDG
jgi:hypothetical protein